MLRQKSEDTSMEEHSPSSQQSDPVIREIRSLRIDLLRFMEQTNQVHINAIVSDLKKDYLDLLAKHQVERAGECLTDRMISDCSMHDTCYQVFLEFLTATANHIRDGSITEEIIRSYDEQLEKIKNNGRFEKCQVCFTEVTRLFKKQVDLLQSLGIISQQECTVPPVSYPDEEIVREILEPVANTTRFQILQAVSSGTKTFTDLSGLTKLRGGNLLFHLKKLQDAGMVLQRHERGDYIIAEKGFRVLSAVRDLYEYCNDRKN